MSRRVSELNARIAALEKAAAMQNGLVEANVSGPWVALENGQAITQNDSLAEIPKDLSSDTAIEPEQISSETPRSFVFLGELFINAAN